MFNFFSKKEKTIIRVYYKGANDLESLKKLHRLGEKFTARHQDYVEKFTLYPRIKTLVIEMEGKIEEGIVQAFFEEVEKYMNCETYQSVETNKKTDNHYLLLS